MMCTCKMVVERVSIEAFFHHIGRRRVNWGLLYRHLPPWRKGYVCTIFLNHLTFSKVKSWWPKVSWLFLCVHINKFLWIYYVQTIFFKFAYLKYHSSKDQIPYMRIVNISTLITILNLENTLGHQKTFLTIKGHQTSCWEQIGKSMQDAFVEYQENEHFIY